MKSDDDKDEVAFKASEPMSAETRLGPELIGTPEAAIISMTTDQVTAILNRNNHGGMSNWTIDPWNRKAAASTGSQDTYRQVVITDFEAIACAEKYLRDEEAARRKANEADVVEQLKKIQRGDVQVIPYSRNSEPADAVPLHPVRQRAAALGLENSRLRSELLKRSTEHRVELENSANRIDAIIAQIERARRRFAVVSIALFVVSITAACIATWLHFHQRGR